MFMYIYICIYIYIHEHIFVGNIDLPTSSHTFCYFSLIGSGPAPMQWLRPATRARPMQVGFGSWPITTRPKKGSIARVI